jgi:hypothetical protein
MFTTGNVPQLTVTPSKPLDTAQLDAVKIQNNLLNQEMTVLKSLTLHEQAKS